jgi:RNA polymerase sigma factor (TIGR02999 family)
MPTLPLPPVPASQIESGPLLSLSMPSSGSTELFCYCYAPLRTLAAAHLRSERLGHTLSATAIVHEVFLRLSGCDHRAWRDAEHFFAVAAASIRRVLVDHARRRLAHKRGGARHARIHLRGGHVIEPNEMVALNDSIERLASLSSRQARIVELKVFGGLTNEQIANLLDLARSTVVDEWIAARAWLTREILGERVGSVKCRESDANDSR